MSRQVPATPNKGPRDPVSSPPMTSAFGAFVTLCLVWGFTGCTCEPDSKPTDVLLPEACNECLTRQSDAGTGCGAEEQACTADVDCENSMLCVLTYDCLEEDDPSACAGMF